MKGFLIPELLESIQLEEFDALNMVGFPHSPITYMGKEHSYLNGGENDYTILKLAQHQYLTYQTSSAGDE